jgi:hypothetical protein
MHILDPAMTISDGISVSLKEFSVTSLSLTRFREMDTLPDVILMTRRKHEPDI